MATHLNSLLEEKDVLTVEEVAAILRVSKATVYRMVRERKIPALYIAGRMIRFPKESFLVWLNSGSFLNPI